MPGVLLRQSKHQRPCSLCGKDAFEDRGNGRWVALYCSKCENVSCTSCAIVNAEEGVSGLHCPNCRGGGYPIYLKPALMEKSVKEMPPQSLEGWPDLDEIVYSQMIDQVSTYLPIIMATLKDFDEVGMLDRCDRELVFGFMRAPWDSV